MLSQLIDLSSRLSISPNFRKSFRPEPFMFPAGRCARDLDAVGAQTSGRSAGATTRAPLLERRLHSFSLAAAPLAAEVCRQVHLSNYTPGHSLTFIVIQPLMTLSCWSVQPGRTSASEARFSGQLELICLAGKPGLLNLASRAARSQHSLRYSSLSRLGLDFMPTSEHLHSEAMQRNKTAPLFAACPSV